MEIEEFDYDLPRELIAQEPAQPRDSSRLMVLHLESDILEHRKFVDLPEYLREGDVLVLNDTRVVPARLRGHKETGGKLEILLLEEVKKDIWKTLLRPSRRVRKGTKVVLEGNGLKGEITDRMESGEWLVKFSYEGEFKPLIERLGEVPLPPYISKPLEDKSLYQTIYARRNGALAAPTAGLHFTENQLAKIRDKGVKIVYVTLHIGVSTFRPLKSSCVENHKMYPEYFEVSEETAQLINQAGGKNIIAVGTSSLRALESAAVDYHLVRPLKGWTDLYIYPGYEFKVVRSLLTNFHLPKSTLMVLVCAFAGREKIMRAYKEAIKLGYRFLSFGDAMLILGDFKGGRQ